MVKTANFIILLTKDFLKSNKPWRHHAKWKKPNTKAACCMILFTWNVQNRPNPQREYICRLVDVRCLNLWSSRSKHQQIRHLVRACFLVHRWLSSGSVFTWWENSGLFSSLQHYSIWILRDTSMSVITDYIWKSERMEGKREMEKKGSRENRVFERFEHMCLEARD